MIKLEAFIVIFCFAFQDQVFTYKGLSTWKSNSYNAETPMENQTANATTIRSKPPVASSHQIAYWYWITRGVIGLVILAGNTMVIYLVAVRRRLQTTANWFILSLCFADLMVGIGIVPASSACYLSTAISCDMSLLGVCFDLLLFVSVANMCIMTIDRYMAVVHPLKYRSFMTNSRIATLICTAWIIPTSISLIPLTWHFSSSITVKQVALKVYGTIQVIVFNVLPCAVMILVYARMFLIAHKHARQIQAIERIQPESQAMRPRRGRREWSAAKAFALLVFLFVFCWVLSAYRHLCVYLDACAVAKPIAYASRILMLANSAINPYIYAVMKSDIRAEVKKILGCTQSTMDATVYGNSSIPSSRVAQALTHTCERQVQAESTL